MWLGFYGSWGSYSNSFSGGENRWNVKNDFVAALWASAFWSFDLVASICVSQALVCISLVPLGPPECCPLLFTAFFCPFS